MTTVAEVLTSVSTAVGIAKTIAEINKGFEEAEYQLKVAQLMTALAEAQIQLSTLQIEVASKDNEIVRLSRFSNETDGLVRHNSLYYRASADGSAIGAPFCAHCIENKTGVFELHRKAMQGYEKFCSHCKTFYPVARTLSAAG